jgi:hypothetical protein
MIYFATYVFCDASNLKFTAMLSATRAANITRLSEKKKQKKQPNFRISLQRQVHRLHFWFFQVRLG